MKDQDGKEIKTGDTVTLRGSDYTVTGGGASSGEEIVRLESEDGRTVHNYPECVKKKD